MWRQSSNKHRHQHHHDVTVRPTDKIPQEAEYRIYAKWDPNELRNRLIPEIVQEFPMRGLRLYGTRLPRCDGHLVKRIGSIEVPPLPPGGSFPSNNREFQIEKALGKRSYRVLDVGSKIKYFLKLEPVGLPKTAPLLKREILALNTAYDSSPSHRRHFLAIFDRGTFPDRFNFIIMQLGDCNIADLRSQRLKGADFSRASALHLACQTLQAVHDVQLNHYYHRDIRAGNFIVGLNDHHRTIYLVNFSLSYEYVARNIRLEKGKKPHANETPRATPKLPWISCRFQSRAFHLGQPSRRLDDVESWMYVMIDIFDQKILPWKYAKSERIGYEQKERLFMGDYAEQLGEYKPYIDIMAKHIEHSRIRSNGIVDFPFFGNVLEQMAKDWKITGKEPLDWMPDPSNPNRNIARTKGEAMIKLPKGSKKKHSPHPRVELPGEEEEDEEFNFLLVAPTEQLTKETAKVKEPSVTAATDTDKKSKEKQQPQQSDGSGKNVNKVSPGGAAPEKDENEKVEAAAAATDKKDINAIASKGRGTRTAEKGNLDEPETKKKDKENEKEKEKKEDKKDEENDAPKSPSKNDDDDASKDDESCN